MQREKVQILEERVQIDYFRVWSQQTPIDTLDQQGKQSKKLTKLMHSLTQKTTLTQWKRTKNEHKHEKVRRREAKAKARESTKVQKQEESENENQ